MTARAGATAAPVDTVPIRDATRLYQEGMIAGLLGALTVAVWFLVLDTLSGRPLHTPTVLGTALFRRGAGLTSPDTLAVSLEMVAMFTWVHVLVFAALGVIAARLLELAEGNPRLGFGVVLLFVFFQFGFTLAAMLLAASVLQALAWPAIFVANLLAATTMALYFRHRHATMQIAP
jgi:hypothetical protein